MSVDLLLKEENTALLFVVGHFCEFLPDLNACSLVLAGGCVLVNGFVAIVHVETKKVKDIPPGIAVGRSNHLFEHGNEGLGHEREPLFVVYVRIYLQYMQEYTDISVSRGR